MDATTEALKPARALLQSPPPGAVALELRRLFERPSAAAQAKAWLVDAALDPFLPPPEVDEDRLPGVAVSWRDAGGRELDGVRLFPLGGAGEDALLPAAMRAARAAGASFHLVGVNGPLERWSPDDPLRTRDAGGQGPAAALRAAGFSVREAPGALEADLEEGRGRQPFLLLPLAAMLFFAPVLLTLGGVKLASLRARLSELWVEATRGQRSRLTLRLGDGAARVQLERSAAAPASFEVPLASVDAVSFAPRRPVQPPTDPGRLRVVGADGRALEVPHRLEASPERDRAIGHALARALEAAAARAR